MGEAKRKKDLGVYYGQTGWKPPVVAPAPEPPPRARPYQPSPFLAMLIAEVSKWSQPSQPSKILVLSKEDKETR